MSLRGTIKRECFSPFQKHLLGLMDQLSDPARQMDAMFLSMTKPTEVA